MSSSVDRARCTYKERRLEMAEQELTDVELTRAAMTPEQLEQTGPEELAAEAEASGGSFLENSGTSSSPETSAQ